MPCPLTPKKYEKLSIFNFQLSTWTMSYNEQLKQLEQIVSEIESGQLSIDQLAAKVKTATKLLADCRKQLTQVESDINKILKPEYLHSTCRDTQL